ncbi:hypothetical protein [Litoreibacter janthinus]|uniref:Uncharacterized protein n=1 Tax=Litoreibacter janthinus TaxID=670154 RepID=A0A1I6HYF1_9RHOB|nr:hypothetical protein [Litoreibacter janthinus]SFR59438.1 hypothetical protein SAMN04488002_3584 [Litoreibacter janthinus]
MGNFYRNVILGTAASFMLVVMAGYAVTSTEEPPMVYTTVDENGAKSAAIGERDHTFSMTAKGAYATEISFVDSVRAWFGVDIEAERQAAHRKSELRKLELRRKGHKTYNTRTKGVLYNGS